MEWDALLVDLESRFEAERRADIAAQAADLAEAEVAAVRLADRLRGAVGRTIRLRTRGGTPVDGVLARAEDGFVLIIGSRFEGWYEYRVSITEFLHRILTGDIRCPAFPEDFPTTGVQMVFGDVVTVADLPTARHSFLTGDQYIRVMDAWPAPWKTIQEEQRKQAGAESGWARKRK